MSSESVQEGELSSEVIQIQTPSLTISCFIQGTAVSTLSYPWLEPTLFSHFLCFTT
jgi:hypothetical protein